MVLFGMLTDTSVPELYLAGFVPGFILAGLFMVAVVVICLLRPRLDGGPFRSGRAGRFRVLPDLVPPTVPLLVVVGSIFAAIATPTQPASPGVAASLGLAAGHRSL